MNCKNCPSRRFHYYDIVCGQSRGGSPKQGKRPQDSHGNAIHARVHQLCLSCRGRLPDDHHRLGNPGFNGAVNEAGRASFDGQPLLHFRIQPGRNDWSVGSRTPQCTPRPLSWLRQDDSRRSSTTELQLRRGTPRSTSLLVAGFA